MGKFNNKIEAEFSPPKTWVLSRALSYQNDEMFESALQSVGVKCPASKITCKKGFKTIHDLLYLRIRQYRAKPNPDMKEVSIAKKAADDVFLMAMKDAEPKVASWKIYAAYYAVRLFGRWSIIPREGDNDNG